jgi:hypothetical protein
MWQPYRGDDGRNGPGGLADWVQRLPSIWKALAVCVLLIVIAAVLLFAPRNKPTTVPLPAYSPGILTNGDFAKPIIAASTQYEPIPAGSTAIPGWTVGGGGVEAYASSYMQHPPDASTEIRLFDNGPGSIRQTVTTIPGEKYVLKWEGAGESGGGQPDKIMHVFWDGKLVAAPIFDTSGYSLTDVAWEALQVTVTAASPTSTVVFADATPDKSYWGSMVGAASLHASS